MSWNCPNCDRKYPDSTLGVPRDADADRKDGCTICFVSPRGTADYVDPGEIENNLHGPKSVTGAIDVAHGTIQRGDESAAKHWTEKALERADEHECGYE